MMLMVEGKVMLLNLYLITEVNAGDLSDTVRTLELVRTLRKMFPLRAFGLLQMLILI